MDWGCWTGIFMENYFYLVKVPDEIDNLKNWKKKKSIF